MKLENAIYEILLGESLQFLGKDCLEIRIENVFEDNSECSKLYESVYQANRAICKKLGIEECKEVETIIGNLDEIQRIVAMKMYNYGYQIAEKEK